jgi:hypothetical protein
VAYLERVVLCILDNIYLVHEQFLWLYGLELFRIYLFLNNYQKKEEWSISFAVYVSFLKRIASYSHLKETL